MKNKYLFGILIFFLFFALPCVVKAGSGNVYVNGNSSVLPYKSYTLDVVGTATSSNIMGVQGVVASSNTSCVTIENVSPVISGSTANSGKFAYLDMTGTGYSGSKTIVRLSIKTVGQSCSANIILSQVKLSFTDSTNTVLSNVVKTIKVSAPPSTNNLLSSLNVNAGSLSPSFNANTTSYSVNVDNNISTINISASPADSKAIISGTGVKNLNYGNNSFTIVVKAESGDTKNYVVNVNRKDNRSGNNNLKGISISNGSLNPGFSSETTSYKMSVPYDVTKLNISATAEDGKATVSVNNPDLIAEKTSNVTITVKAENGSTKTYTISVARGKDPNKVLNTDNKLLSLTPSVGMLSPVFDSNKNNYYIYLPYEIDRITFDYEISDKEYGVVEKSGNEELIPDSDNYYSFKVIAEDGSENIYTVTVNRAKNHDGESNDEIIKKIEAQNVDGLKCSNNNGDKIIIIVLIIILFALAILSTGLLLEKFDVISRIKHPRVKLKAPNKKIKK